MKTKKYIIGTIAILVILLGGMALLRSSQNDTEGGTTQLTPVQSISHGHGLAVDVADPSKLYIATHYGLLVIQNEKDLYQVGKKKDDYMGFSIHPTNPKIFFSSGHPSFGGNIGFQKSEDAGITWKKLSNGVNGPVDFHAMAVSPVNPDLIYGGYQGKLQRSTDGGKNWEIVNDTVQVLYLTADSQDENTVFAATPAGVMISKDKGATWNSISKDLEGGGVSVIVVNPADSKQILAFSEKIGGLGKSVDGGITWKKVGETFNGEVVLHLAYSKLQPNIVYALTDKNSIYKSSDGGDTWIKLR